MKYVSQLSIVLAAVFLVSCGSGSALVTGTVRPAIDDYTTIRVITKMPDGAEEIAIINASSDEGRSVDDDFIYAVRKLTKKAAKVGANAVVITDRRTRVKWSASGAGPGGQGPSHITTPTEGVVVQGLAVWVEPNNE